MIHLDRLWLFLGSAPIRLSTVITLVLTFALVVWRFRSKGWRLALYNGAVAALFTLFLYEILFNITGRFPPTGNLPPWGIGLMVLFLAEKHVIADTPKQTPTSRQREWAEKAVKRYAEAQEKKWRNWNEAMFEPN